jgi:NAD-dependent DNA ligase
MIYVLTGKFDLGPRAACEREITERGGLCARDVTYKTNVMVIGSSGSRDWIETAYGRKIQSAIEHNTNGAGIAIVSEAHWVRFL